MNYQTKDIIILGRMDNSDGTLELWNRVYSPLGLSPTINCVGGGNILAEYKIRRLTETECLKLMGVSGEDVKSIKSAVSPSQCYKQAGNSIVVDVLEAIFDSMFNGSDTSNEQMSIEDFL